MQNNLEAHKYQIIKAIIEIEQEAWLLQIEALLKSIRSQEKIKALAKPMRQKLDIQAIAKEQGYNPNPQIIEQLGGAWNDVEESLEELLEMLKG